MLPLRFALVSTFYPPYAPDREGLRVQWLARALTLRGHSVEVFHDLDAYQAISGALPDVPEQDHGVPVHRVQSSPNRVASRHGRFQPYLERSRLAEWLNGRFDVVHFHDLLGMGGPSLWRLGTGVKLQSLEDYWMICPTRNLRRAGTSNACSGQHCSSCMLMQGRWPQRPWFRGDHRAVEPIDSFLVPSATSARHHRAFGLRAPISVVPPYLPSTSPALQPAEPPQHERPYFLLKATRGVGRDLAELVEPFGDDIDADLVVLGPERDAHALRRMARGRKNVRFLDEALPVARQGLLREALAVLLPPDRDGQFPQSVLEAFREGTPVVAHASGAALEVVEETGGGYLYKTMPELRAIYYRLAHDPAHGNVLGRRAFSGYARNWREDVAINAYFDVIRDVAIRRGYSGLLNKLSTQEMRHGA